MTDWSEIPDIFYWNEDGRELKPQTAGSAGVDLYITEDVLVMPQQVHKVGTGTHFKMPPGVVGKLHIRSSYAAKGIGLSNGTGIIDSDYVDEVKFLLINQTKSAVHIPAGHRVGQIIFEKTMPFSLGRFPDKKLFEATTRKGGFGSTGTD